MTFQFTSNGLKSLKALDKKTVERILKKLETWQAHDAPLSFATPIRKDRGLFRFRVGSYRIIVSPDYTKDTLSILKVDHRSRIYQ